MNEWMKMQMGIVEPKTAEEIRRQATLEGMRAEIWKAMYDSPIIRACLESARHHGLSGEDTYTMLAYHALRSLEDHYQRRVELLCLMPVPSIRVPREPDNG